MSEIHFKSRILATALLYGNVRKQLPAIGNTGNDKEKWIGIKGRQKLINERKRVLKETGEWGRGWGKDEKDAECCRQKKKIWLKLLQLLPPHPAAHTTPQKCLPGAWGRN